MGKDAHLDYQNEVHLKKSRALRLLLIVAGTLCLILGIIGIFLPILPTTPFLLVTAACYSRSSTRFYNWLMNTRFLGPYIRTWRDEKRIPLRAKILAVTMITLTIGTSVIYFIPILSAKIATGAVGVAVSAYICRFPS